MGSLTEYLLIDPETGKFRCDDEAILASMIFTNGDCTLHVSHIIVIIVGREHRVDVDDCPRLDVCS